MNLNTDDIVSFINLCTTLPEAEKQTLLLRLLDELEVRGNRLSAELTAELSALWEVEQAYLEAVVLPELQRLEDGMESDYNAELERIRPQLDRLVETYHRETEELKSEYDKAFRQIDLEMDTLLKASASQGDAAQIEAIKHKLSKSSSNNS